ncbi:Histone acetyltransferase [Marinobacterium lacunae]|uniref:Histone acetyltransferase n=1 Tax=Marinobacterium lacunae TaxID=1232683 RepID=A0A081FZS2_9GAMM|nr:GNAT family N-acetyltransferase [Marinobacterium lacunae]KEA64027.1 Histone acetyltransferase [Marinobacterium lacunae]MBR9885286.1 GNAT family N-acetyltransferase [Oceanospirillales bacterium]
MVSQPNIEIIEADLGVAEQADDFRQLLNEYAQDPMGGAHPLDQDVLERLPLALTQRSDSYTLIAYCDSKPAGLLNAFEGFSTFACAPLLNIHDVVVSQGFRGKGIADLLLEAAEGIARRTGCCKLTLEVLENNTRAQSVYRRCGYAGYELDPETGKAMFWQKVLKD